MKKISPFLFVIVLLCLFAFYTCNKKQVPANSDFEHIKEKGELTILTLNSSVSFFIYREDTLGYAYDLAKDFCATHNLKLNVKTASTLNKLTEMLVRGEGDLVAYPVPVTNQMKDSLTYCGLQQTTHQVLVQRANKGDTLVKNVTQLIGKEIHVIYKTKYFDRIMNLNDELGEGIRIVPENKDSISTEDLVEMVSIGKIKYTLCDEYLAKLNKTYYKNIDVSLPISYDQRVSWAVNKASPNLAAELDRWFSENNNTPMYKGITKKYFELSKQPIEGEYVAPENLPKGAISIYDDLFKKHAAGTIYDWHLLAAISYHESRFVNNLTSWAGASGIMGLMPRTARSLRLSDDDRMNPDLSIGAAVTLLARLEKLFKNVPDKNERMKFILAAYNGGNGHINDAQALAREYGASPLIWDENVKTFLQLKSLPEYYEDPVCKCGYFRAGETVAYVDLVLKTTERFKRISPK